MEEDFAAADLVIERRFRWPRSGGQPLETVGAVATFDDGAGRFTIQCNTSMYNYCGWMIADTLRVSPHKLNIVPTLAGGSFGSKMFVHKVPVLAGVLARAVGRPVKFVEDRIDNTTSCDNHASDRVYYAKLALKRDGTLLSLKTRIIDDYGAYFQFGVGQHGNALSQCVGPTASTASRSISPPCSPTSVSRAPIAASAPRSRTSSSSGWWTRRLTSSASTASRSGGRTSSSRTVPLSDPDREHVRQR